VHDADPHLLLAQFGPVGRAGQGGGQRCGQRPLITADGSPVELDGGTWGRGRLVPQSSGGWRWEPRTAFGSEACRYQGTWSSRRGEMDLRLRVATGMLLVAEGLRVTEAGRSQMLAALASTGITRVIADLADRGVDVSAIADLCFDFDAIPAGPR
jgi:hypothetical protein